MSMNGLSLRQKILLALTLLPVIAVSFFLWLAVKIFEEDKIAYVFDSSLSVSKSRSQRVSTEIQSFASSIEAIVSTYNPQTKGLSQVGNDFFERERRLDAMSMFSVNKAGGLDPLIEIQKDQVKADFAGKQDQVQKLGAEVVKKSLIIHKAPFNGDHIWISIYFEPHTENDLPVVAVVLARAHDLSQAFSEGGAYMSFLAITTGEAVFSPIINDHGQKEWSPTDIWNQVGSNKKIDDGTAEILSPSKGQFLVSFSRVGIGDLVVVSMVEKKSALKAVDRLLLRSLLFFILVVCATIWISVLTARRMTAALSQLLTATEKVSHGNFDVRVAVKNKDEIGQLGDSFNKMAIEVSRLIHETAEKARMESELETAKAVQDSLFPKQTMERGPIKISGHYVPASECGGDWWYHCEIGERVFIWIGDATGHGAASALLTSAARAVASVIQSAPDLSPVDIITFMNRAIFDVSNGKMMMTFFLGAIDKHTGELTYVNASHEAPMVLKKMDTLASRGDFIALNEVNNPRLGENPDNQFRAGVTTLEAGDRLVFYTDGVVDLKNPESKAWGERKFLKTLAESLHEHQDVEHSMQQIVSSIAAYRQDRALDDDVTLVLCDFKGVA